MHYRHTLGENVREIIPRPGVYTGPCLHVFTLTFYHYFDIEYTLLQLILVLEVR